MWGGGGGVAVTDLMLERLATFSEKYEFEDEFVENVWMQDMMHFCLVRWAYACSAIARR